MIILRPAILTFLVGCALSATAQPGQSQPEQAASPTIAPALQPFVDDQMMAGAVTLVATKDRVLDLEATGYADLDAKVTMRTDDLFWIASMTKAMTATALLMLVDEGKVSLDDPVEKYIPAFKGQMVETGIRGKLVLPRHPVMVRELLNHTSGLPRRSERYPAKSDIATLKDAANIYGATPLQFQPGDHFQYSSAGFDTIGRVIEVASGMPYERFMEERLFIPLGMIDTTFWPDKEQILRLAKAYKANKDNSGLEETPIDVLSYPLDDPNRKPMPSGGLFSTAGDLVKFYQMILNGGMYGGKRYISAAAVKEMTSNQTEDAVKVEYGFEKTAYGFGWSIATGPLGFLSECSGISADRRFGWFVGSNAFGHGGSAMTNVVIDPQAGLITIFLAQLPHSGAWRREEGYRILPIFTSMAYRMQLLSVLGGRQN